MHNRTLIIECRFPRRQRKAAKNQFPPTSGLINRKLVELPKPMPVKAKKFIGLKRLNPIGFSNTNIWHLPSTHVHITQMPVDYG